MTDNPTPEEPSEMPDPIAERDQALASLREMAVRMVAYHKALVDAGLDGQSALLLTISYQQTVVQGGGYA